MFGDHLGFIAGYSPEMAASIVIAKLAGGISAIILAWIVTQRLGRERQKEKGMEHGII